MGLGELLDRIRDQYTAQFTTVRDRLVQRTGTRVLSEVALCNEHGEVVVEGALGLPMRLDLVVVSGGAVSESLSVDSGRVLVFEPISFIWAEGLRVTLHPFPWDCLSAWLPAPATPCSWGPLVGWFHGVAFAACRSRLPSGGFRSVSPRRAWRIHASTF